MGGLNDSLTGESVDCLNILDFDVKYVFFTLVAIVSIL
jgi:hypothetical protein